MSRDATCLMGQGQGFILQSVRSRQRPCGRGQIRHSDSERRGVRLSGGGCPHSGERAMGIGEGSDTRAFMEADLVKLGS